MDRTTHPVEHEEVMAYLDGELEPARAAEVAAHLEACADCAALAAEFRAVSDQLRSWPVEPAPDSLSPMPVNEEQEVKRFWVLSSYRRPWLLGFASAAVLAIIFVGLWSFNSSYEMQSEPATFGRTPVEPPPGFTPGMGSEDRMVAGGGGGDDRDKVVEELNRARWSFEASGALSSVPPAEKGKLPRSEFEKPVGPMVVYTAKLAVVVKQFDGAQAAVERIAREHDGFLANLATATPEGRQRSLQATLRVPAARLDSALEALRALGRVDGESQSGEDVTEQHVDLTARLKNARSTEQRLLEVLRTRTGKIRDVLEAEAEIARVREEIERMEAQRRSLEDRVALATIELRLTEEYQAQLQMAPPSAATRARNAAVEGWRSLTEGLLGLGLFLLRYGPALLLWAAVLFYPARWAWRRMRGAAAFDRPEASQRT